MKDKILGVDYQSITAYKNIKKSLNSKIEYNFINSYFTGIKWECVEFVRRWYIQNYKITFMEIENAIDILDIKYFFSLKDGSRIKIKIIKTKDKDCLPEIGWIVIFKVSEEYPKGHVAIITFSDGDRIYISEQNYSDNWEDKQFSREIKWKSENTIFCFIRI